jgi:5-bromo-4-chloroindolyl phosphate hydrolysis protein
MKALSLRDPEVAAKRDELCLLAGKILKALEEDTSRLPRTRKFLSYYLPTTAGLLERYENLEKNPAGENVGGTLTKIKEMLSKVETAFRKQLDNLYEADAMDISADIQVMQQMMAAEGLLEES